MLVHNTVAVPSFVSRKTRWRSAFIEPGQVLRTGIDQQSFTGFVVLSDQRYRRFEWPSPFWCAAESVFEPLDKCCLHIVPENKKGALNRGYSSSPTTGPYKIAQGQRSHIGNVGPSTALVRTARRRVWWFRTKQLLDAHASFKLSIIGSDFSFQLLPKDKGYCTCRCFADKFNLWAEVSLCLNHSFICLVRNVALHAAIVSKHPKAAPFEPVQRRRTLANRFCLQ